MDYSVVVADQERDRTTVIDVWRGRLGDADRADEKYQWFYRDNPNGPSTLLILKHGDETPVGVAGLGARLLFSNGAPLLAGMLVDLIVLEAHRTAYPALLLQRTMNRIGLATHTVLYGLPNDKAMPIVKRLGYVPVGDLVRYAMVLRSAEYISRYTPPWLSTIGGSVADRLMPLYYRPHRALMGEWTTEWREDFDARFDGLWSRARRQGGIIGTRDRRFLTWRFGPRPDVHARVFTLAPAGSSELAGYAVCESDGTTMRVLDFLVDPEVDDALRVLVHLLARRSFEEKCRVLTLDFMGDDAQRKALTATGMVARERQPFFASFGDSADSRLRENHWYVTRADLDV